MERLDQFMSRANARYYATRDPYADFTTAPEISQAFGEILGLWIAVVWESIGRPDPVVFAEAGPGRGTLMADALRAIGKVAPAFRAALRVHLIETSPALRARQAARLEDAVWHASLADLPPGPLLLLANEFLDALPIRQFVRRGAGWAERFVHDGRFIEFPAESAPLTQPSPPRAGEGEVVEVGGAALEVSTLLGRRLADAGGAALFIDYGPERSAPGDSLQAIRNGCPADPLGDAGCADLTAHVDFQAIAEAARRAGAAAFGPVPLGLLLTRLGLFQRTDRLARGQSPARAASLVAAAQRLAEPMHMGRLFKTLALGPPGLPTPPGFEVDA
jgi:NADH dehydrogenase [ubiquinone] 1 alpha subcomplex assembly factor 7